MKESGGGQPGTAPGGDAMIVRYRREEAAARLRLQEVRRPLAWRVHQSDAAEFAAQGKHCAGRRGTRQCRNPIAVVAWRWWRSAAAGRVLVSERFLCTEHAAEFAARHRIEIEPPPDVPSISRGRPGGTR